MQTIEIGGRPIAVIGGTRDVVEGFASEGMFEQDVLSLEDEDGQPLWDGAGEFAPFVRDPHPEEVACFERQFANALSSGEADPADRDDYVAFLLKVVDPTDDPSPGDGMA